jgi:hypothetical protein
MIVLRFSGSLIFHRAIAIPRPFAPSKANAHLALPCEPEGAGQQAIGDPEPTEGRR